MKNSILILLSIATTLSACQRQDPSPPSNQHNTNPPTISNCNSTEQYMCGDWDLVKFQSAQGEYPVGSYATGTNYPDTMFRMYLDTTSSGTCAEMKTTSGMYGSGLGGWKANGDTIWLGCSINGPIGGVIVKLDADSLIYDYGFCCQDTVTGADSLQWTRYYFKRW